MTGKAITKRSKLIKNYTKTHKYLMTVYMNEDTDLAYIMEDFFPVGKWETFQKPNTYLYDESLEHSHEYDGYLYFLCSTDNPRFNRAIKSLTSTMYYGGHYQIGDIRTHLAIIKIKYPHNLRIRKLMESRYSEIYRDEVGKYPTFTRMFTQRAFFTGKRKNPKFSLEPSFYILTHDKEYFYEEIATLSESLSDEVIKDLSFREFDQPIDINREFIISNQLTSY